MLIGIPCETAAGETRVAATPETVKKLKTQGHTLRVQAGAQLDTGIVRTLWMTADEIRASVARHRTPLLLRCVEDYLLGKRIPLDYIFIDLSVYNNNL